MKILSSKKYEELMCELQELKINNDKNMTLSFKLKAKVIEEEKINNGFAKVIDDLTVENANLKKELKVLKGKLTKEINKNKQGE